MTDEIYEWILYDDGGLHEPLAVLDPENVVIVSSISKTGGATGLANRVGRGVGAEDPAHTSCARPTRRVCGYTAADRRRAAPGAAPAEVRGSYVRNIGRSGTSWGRRSWRPASTSGRRRAAHTIGSWATAACRASPDLTHSPQR